jgi:hypothetical protein
LEVQVACLLPSGRERRPPLTDDAQRVDVEGGGDAVLDEELGAHVAACRGHGAGEARGV